MKKKYLLNFLTLIITLLILFIIFEFSLRIFDPQPIIKRNYIEASPTIFEEGENIPWQLKSLVDTRHLSVFDEWNVSVKTNSFGLRDQEYTTELNGSKKKILLLGDSFTFGYGVEQEDTYANLLEKLLGDNYVVINAGYADGYSPDTEYIYLKEKGLKFNPDVLLLGFFVGNDIDDVGSNDLVGDDKGLPKKIVSNNFYIDENNRLRAKYNSSIDHNESILYKIKLFLNYNLHSYIFLKDKLRPIYSKLTKDESILENSIYGNKYGEDLELLWEKTQNILLEMNSIMKNQGKDFIIVLIPKREQFYEEKDDTYNFSNPNQKLINFGRDNGIPIIDLLPYFKQHPNNFNLYFKKDGHWNSGGHKFAAEKIYEELEKLGFA